VHEVNRRLPAMRTSAEMMNFFIGVVEPPSLFGPSENCKPLKWRPPRRGFALAGVKLSPQRSASRGLEIVAVLTFQRISPKLTLASRGADRSP
jgi:hypothetical protein